jgi:hypothetical protein
MPPKIRIGKRLKKSLDNTESKLKKSLDNTESKLKKVIRKTDNTLEAVSGAIRTGIRKGQNTKKTIVLKRRTPLQTVTKCSTRETQGKENRMLIGILC